MELRHAADHSIGPRQKFEGAAGTGSSLRTRRGKVAVVVGWSVGEWVGWLPHGMNHMIRHGRLTKHDERLVAVVTAVVVTALPLRGDMAMTLRPHDAMKQQG